MDLKLLAIVLFILNALIYSFFVMKVRRAGGKGSSILKKVSLKKPKEKKLKPVIPRAESTATWDEEFEEELDRYWSEEKKPEKRETHEEEGEKEPAEEERTLYDEERRVRLLWENYIQKLDTFIGKLERGNSKRYFDYYKEYENLDKFYSRFIFNFGIYLDEIEKNKASGRLGYCSTLLKEMLGEV
jgi:hypothetical protein